MEEHRRLHPVEMPVGVSRQVLGIGLDEGDIVDTQRSRPGMTVTQDRRGGIDGDDLCLGIGLRHRQHAMANGNADIEDAPRRPVGPRFARPSCDRLAAAIGQCPHAAAGGDKDADVVIGAGRDVIRDFLAEITAGHAMRVDGALVARDGDRRVEFQPFAIAAGGGGTGIEVGQLPLALAQAPLVQHKALHQVLA